MSDRPPKRRVSRQHRKAIHAYLRPETYAYISELAGDASLGQAIEFLVLHHRSKRESDEMAGKSRA